MQTTHTEKGSTTRAGILAEARDRLVAQGYERLVMREVADGCGIKLGNLQYYFPTVQALLLAVIEAEGEQDLRTIGAARATAGTPIAALETMVRELIARWRSDSGAIYATLNLLSLHNEAYAALYTRIYRAHYSAVESAIADAVPGIPTSECRIRAQLLTALIDGAPLQARKHRQAFVNRIVQEALNIALGRDA